MSEKVSSNPTPNLTPPPQAPFTPTPGAASRSSKIPACAPRPLEAPQLSTEAAKTVGASGKSNLPGRVGAHLDGTSDKRLREVLDDLTTVLQTALQLTMSPTSADINQSMTPDKALQRSINKLKTNPRQDVLQALQALQTHLADNTALGNALDVVKGAMTSDPLDFAFGALKSIARLIEEWHQHTAAPMTAAPPPVITPSQQVAQRLATNDRIRFADRHIAPHRDAATADRNMQDAAAGHDARRSGYRDGHDVAPGGTTPLRESMLRGLEALAQKYRLDISEVSGGAHSQHSRHYAGLAFDVTAINGLRVSKDNKFLDAFMADARATGATEVLGPGKSGHDFHVHVAWPRPSP